MVLVGYKRGPALQRTLRSVLALLALGLAWSLGQRVTSLLRGSPQRRSISSWLLQWAQESQEPFRRTSRGADRHQQRGADELYVLKPGKQSASSRAAAREAVAEAAAAEAAAPRPLRWPGFAPSRCDHNQSSRLGPRDFELSPTLPWAPEAGRYLFPLCQYGRLSNQQQCLRKYFWYAALLQRTLILPRQGSDQGLAFTQYRWDWANLLDAHHIRQCLGDAGPGARDPLSPAQGDKRPEKRTGSMDIPRATQVLTLDEFLQREGQQCLNLDRSFALLPRGAPLLDPGHATPGLCPPGLGSDADAEEVVQEGETLTVGDLEAVRHKAAGDAVISLGTAFYEVLAGHNTLAPVAPFRVHPDRCGDMWAPRAELRALAADLVQALTDGAPYAALHLRRGDFGRRESEGKLHFSVPQVARVLAGWLGHVRVATLYVATDGTPREVEELAQLLGSTQAAADGMRVLSKREIGPSWRSKIERFEVGSGGVMLAVVEKLICAGAVAFMGTPISTFSEDIARLRVAGSQASCWDTLMFDEERLSREYMPP